MRIKIIICVALSTFLLCGIYLADGHMMDFYDPEYPARSFGTGLVGILSFAVESFIFSAIFWMTHRWLVKNQNG